MQACGCGCVHGAVDVWQHVGAGRVLQGVCPYASVFANECLCECVCVLCYVCLIACRVTVCVNVGVRACLWLCSCVSCLWECVCDHL